MGRRVEIDNHDNDRYMRRAYAGYFVERQYEYYRMLTKARPIAPFDTRLRVRLWLRKKYGEV